MALFFTRIELVLVPSDDSSPTLSALVRSSLDLNGGMSGCA